VGFDSGSLTFRMYYPTGALPGDAVRRFASDAAPPLNMLGPGGMSGWVTGRHLLDREITEAKARIGGYLWLTLMKAERRIPPALLRAECMLAELARQQRDGGAINRSARAEIRREVTDRLLPDMPPQLSGISFVLDAAGEWLYATALSSKASETLAAAFKKTTGADILEATPAAIALKRKQKNVRDMDPASFSPEVPDSEAEPSLGQDFLTWLWFVMETRGGSINAPGRGEFGFMIEGPLVFVAEGNGAHQAVLNKGTPLLSAEAKTALLSGKKLCAARLTMARENDKWSVYLDSETFGFRSLKFPKTAPAGLEGRFMERMSLLETFRDAFLAMFDAFVDERFNTATWRETCREMKKWVAGRQARR